MFLSAKTTSALPEVMTLMPYKVTAVRTVGSAFPSEVFPAVRTSVKQQIDDDSSNDHQQSERQEEKMDHHQQDWHKTCDSQDRTGLFCSLGLMDIPPFQMTQMKRIQFAVGFFHSQYSIFHELLSTEKNQNRDWAGTDSALGWPGLVLQVNGMNDTSDRSKGFLGGAEILGNFKTGKNTASASERLIDAAYNLEHVGSHRRSREPNYQAEPEALEI